MDKGKRILIKDDMTGNINTTTLSSKTKIAFIRGAIANKNTFMRSKIKFVIIVRSKKREATTSESFKQLIVRRLFVQRIIRRLIVQNWCGEAIDEIDCCLESKGPKILW